jgi:hypothetical protein
VVATGPQRNPDVGRPEFGDADVQGSGDPPAGGDGAGRLGVRQPQPGDLELFALGPTTADLVGDVADGLARHRDPVQPRAVRPGQREHDVGRRARVRIVLYGNEISHVAGRAEAQCVSRRLAVREPGIVGQPAEVGISIARDHPGSLVITADSCSPASTMGVGPRVDLQPRPCDHDRRGNSGQAGHDE